MPRQQPQITASGRSAASEKRRRARTVSFSHQYGVGPGEPLNAADAAHFENMQQAPELLGECEFVLYLHDDTDHKHAQGAIRFKSQRDLAKVAAALGIGPTMVRPLGGQGNFGRYLDYLHHERTYLPVVANFEWRAVMAGALGERKRLTVSAIERGLYDGDLTLSAVADEYTDEFLRHHGKFVKAYELGEQRRREQRQLTEDERYLAELKLRAAERERQEEIARIEYDRRLAVADAERRHDDAHQWHSTRLWLSMESAWNATPEGAEYREAVAQRRREQAERAAAAERARRDEADLRWGIAFLCEDQCIEGDQAACIAALTRLMGGPPTIDAVIAMAIEENGGTPESVREEFRLHYVDAQQMWQSALWHLGHATDGREESIAWLKRYYARVRGWPDFYDPPMPPIPNRGTCAGWAKIRAELLAVWNGTA